MRKILYGMFLCALILSGCQSAARKTSTLPAHDVTAAPVYPGSKSGSIGNANPAYPGPNPALNGPSSPYPGPTNPPAGTMPTTNQYAPEAGDTSLERGTATVSLKNSGVVKDTASPVQVALHLVGTLPTPCNKLRVSPAQPDDQKHIQVDVYSVIKTGEMCTEVIQNFDVYVPLGSLPTGHYSIYINGELLAEFDV